MQRWTKAFLAAGLAAVLVAPAVAQRPDGQRRGGFPGGGGFGGPVTVFRALRSEAVQKELAITEDQKTKLTDLGEKVSAATREAYGGGGGFGGGDQSREEREKRMTEMREKSEKVIADNKPALTAILSADQMSRLEQIVLQAKGGEALTEKDIQAKLMVTDEQKSKLASVNKDFDDKTRALFTGGGGGRPDPESFRANMEKRNTLTKEKNEALVAVLTPAQAEQFDLMKGKALSKEDLDSVRGGGGRGPGGGGPGGGRGGEGGNRPQRPATEN